ncbi:hypothetical protein EW146_g3005 [Bondarzewia mesenterica]|uniref:NAD-capped RNA hydrolase RAI1 n=1 Tax=Bondarzewia mesenterica TaxID=1095465 RepID=A0A4S4M183_9AGAM|nr:hypothetical protein EW146_g3005 [Bondarzewia mesenterica]
MSVKRPVSTVLEGEDPSDQQRTELRFSSPHPPPLANRLSYPPISQPSARQVPFQQPLPLLTFSYTPAHELEFTDAAMRYYVDPPRGADLENGYNRWVQRVEDKGRIDSLLRAYSKVRKQNEAGMANVDVGVVGWRGVMTKILTAPYEERDGWELNVMLVDGTLYLEEHSSNAQLERMNQMSRHQRRQMYHGYAFESWCTSSSPSSRPGWGGDVNTNVQWCSVVKTKLGDTRIVIGGEVDCVRGNHNGRNDTMVELKTSMNIRGARDEARFEKKLLKFYFQSFLLGVPEIVVGFRTPKGQLTTVQSFQTMQLPRMVRGKPGAWDPQVSLAWGQDFLSWLRRSAQDQAGTSDRDARAQVWRVKFTPQSGVDMVLLDEAGVKEVEAGEERVGFLPRWYWKELDDMQGSFGKSQGLRPLADSTTGTSSLPPGWRLAQHGGIERRGWEVHRSRTRRRRVRAFPERRRREWLKGPTGLRPGATRKSLSLTLSTRVSLIPHPRALDSKSPLTLASSTAKQSALYFTNTTKRTDFFQQRGMTTPSSSVTTPSPPMSYLQADAIAPGVSISNGGMTATERDEKQRVKQKILARAELSKLTRGLRARLSYATYKATHNVSHISFGDLEAHAKSESAYAPRIAPPKNYYDNPATQGNGAMLLSAGISSTQRRGSMAPPTSIPSSSTRGRESPSLNATQSLYASILAPPPTKRARTIHNPDAPPVAAPPKMTNGTPRHRRGSEASTSSKKPRTRTGSSSQAFSSVAERTRAQSRHRRDETGKSHDATRRSKGKGRRREETAEQVEDSLDVDMKAAATLTHLLRNSRSSLTAGTASPRSSISAGSDVGSAQSLSQFAQSSTRTTAPSSLLPSAESSFMIPGVRPKTPPHGRRSAGASEMQTTPKMGNQTTPASSTVDQEAVNLLAFFHESPSPARPTTTRNRDAQDAAAYRSLGPVELKARGRVLFPAPPESALAHRMLARDNSGSFTSTSTLVADTPSRSRLGNTSTIVMEPSRGDYSPSQLSMVRGDEAQRNEDEAELKPTNMLPNRTNLPPPLLLPPLPSPSPSARLGTARIHPASPPVVPKLQSTQPTTPGTYTFNLNEFINVSPSPGIPQTRTPGILKPGLSGLRADVGRKLFEEEQQEPMNVTGDVTAIEGAGKGPLGAGIHLSRF